MNGLMRTIRNFNTITHAARNVGYLTKQIDQYKRSQTSSIDLKSKINKKTRRVTEMAKVVLEKGKSKGVKVKLEKESGGSKRFRTELSWDINGFDTGTDFDLDVVAILTDGNGKLLEDNIKNLVFYGNEKKSSACGGVIISDDNRTGEGDGVDEWIEVDFSKINPNAERVDIAITIYKAQERNQNFGAVENARCIIKDLEKNENIIDYYLDDAPTSTGIIMAQFMKRSNQWEFKVVEGGFNEGFEAVLSRYAIEA